MAPSMAQRCAQARGGVGDFVVAINHLIDITFVCLRAAAHSSAGFPRASHVSWRQTDEQLINFLVFAVPRHQLGPGE
jgi:hypothetical protein